MIHARSTCAGDTPSSAAVAVRRFTPTAPPLPETSDDAFDGLRVARKNSAGTATVTVVCTSPDDGAALADSVDDEELESDGGTDRSPEGDADAEVVARVENLDDPLAMLSCEELVVAVTKLVDVAVGNAELVTASVGGGDACGEREAEADELMDAEIEADAVDEDDSRADEVALALRVAEPLERADRETDADCVAVRERAAEAEGERDGAADAEGDDVADADATPVRDADGERVGELLAQGVAGCVAAPAMVIVALGGADCDCSADAVASGALPEGHIEDNGDALSGALLEGHIEDGGDALEHRDAAGDALELGVTADEREGLGDADAEADCDALLLPHSVATCVIDAEALE